jgi:hypothetical protein
MICPKCGFEQPESPECVRCGVIVSRYKGSAVSTPPPPAPMASPVFAEPAPAPAGAGTVYDGSASVGGGTVYQGPPPGSAAAVAAPGTPRVPSAAVLVITQRLRVGETLSESFSIYFRNFIPFTILTAVAFSPIFLGAGLLTRQVATTNAAVAGGGSALVALVTLLLCVPISTAAITYGVFQEMRGRDTSLGSCLSVGLSSLLPVLSVAILQILILFGAVIAAVVPVVFLISGMLAGGTRSSAACSIMLLPLLLLCYVPAIMLALRYFVAVPAAVEERPGAREALRRSAFLTEGQRGRIFGILLVLGVLNLGVNLGAALVPGAGAVLGPLLSLVMTGLFATTCAVIYYRLRSFHESIDVDQIASVFA